MDQMRDFGSRAIGAVKAAGGYVIDRAGDVAGRVVNEIVGDAQSALSGIISGVSKVLPNMLPTVTACLATLSYRGSQGSFSAASHYLSLTASFLEMAQPAPEKFGSPCCKHLAIGNLTGFCLTQNAMFEISGTVDEEQAIEELFNSGVILDWTGEAL